MYDFEALVGELLRGRPELSREELLRRIEEKKRTVGAGYLTDQGALFPGGWRAGVSLRKADASSDMTINDLYIGTNDITVVARVLGVYPVSTYKKKDGRTGKYRRLALFDGRSSVKFTAWDEMADEIEKSGVTVDTPVRVVSGYVKQGLDGKPNLNLGKRGRVEVVSDEKVVAKLVPLSAVTEKLTMVSQEKQFIAVECVVSSEPKYTEFVRSDGSPGSLFQFGVAGDGGKGEVRMVIWNPSTRPELKRGQKVVITNVKAKRTSNGEYEVHGDAGSVVVLMQKAGRMELMVAAITVASSGMVILALGKDRKVRVVEVGREAEEPTKGEVIVVTPDSESDGRMYCKTRGSLEVLDGRSFPGLDALSTKLRDARDEASQIMVEAIALSHGNVDDVSLKDGATVKKGELTIGDDTGEIRLVAWRELSGRVSGIQPGERLRIVGATPKATKMGAWVLQITNLTVVEKLGGSH